MTSQEIYEEVSEDIKKILDSFLIKKAKANDVTYIAIKNSVLNYLQQTMLKFNYLFLPKVVVQGEGPFVTINFYDQEGNRLDTVEDTLKYMEGLWLN